MDRDYCAEMRQAIDDATRGDEGYVAGAVATEIVEKLRVTDSDLLTGWLDAQAVQFVRQAITARDGSIRGRIQRTAQARRFGEAVQRYGDGDTTALDSFMTMPFTVEGNVHKPLGKLNHDELLYVREDYQERVKENQFYVSVMDKLAECVTTGVVEDHFTEDQLRAMFTLFR